MMGLIIVVMADGFDRRVQMRVAGNLPYFQNSNATDIVEADNMERRDMAVILPASQNILVKDTTSVQLDSDVASKSRGCHLVTNITSDCLQDGEVGLSHIADGIEIRAGYRESGTRSRKLIVGVGKIRLSVKKKGSMDGHGKIGHAQK